MRAIIEIDMDTPSFSEHPQGELVCVLDDLLDELEDMVYLPWRYHRQLKDSDGNLVGVVQVDNVAEPFVVDGMVTGVAVGQ